MRYLLKEVNWHGQTILDLYWTNGVVQKRFARIVGTPDNTPEQWQEARALAREMVARANN